MKTLMSLGLALLLSACASLPEQHPADAFSPEAFFNGPLVAEGVVLDRGGHITRSFVATIDATWDQHQGVLDEAFVWDDGEQEYRKWLFLPNADGSWTGTAGDVEGEAHLVIHGQQLRMNYLLRIEGQSRTVTLRMDDRLYSASPQQLINHTRMTFWGIHVGDIFLTMRRT